MQTCNHPAACIRDARDTDACNASSSTVQFACECRTRRGGEGIIIGWARRTGRDGVAWWRYRCLCLPEPAPVRSGQALESKTDAPRVVNSLLHHLPSPLHASQSRAANGPVHSRSSELTQLHAPWRSRRLARALTLAAHRVLEATNRRHTGRPRASRDAHTRRR